MIKKCFECDADADHLHHVIPLSLGGTKTVPLCEKCHGKIHDVEFVNHRRLIRRGMKKLKKKNKKYCKEPTYGYKFIEDKLIVDEEEQKIINIIKEFSRNVSFSEIARRLNERGYTNRAGKKFAPMTISRIIKNN